MTPTGPLTESWDFSGSINRSSSQGQAISGTIGALVKFLSSTSLGDSIVTESGVTNTVGGNLRFGLTTQAGLRLNNLTTVQRDALTAGAGDLIWNTTTLTEDVYSGAAWLSRQAISYAAVANSNYVIAAPVNVVAYTSIAATRTVTLPAASAVPTGSSITVMDLSGSLSSSIGITVAPQGGDTVNGSTSQTLKTSYGVFRFISDGTSKWTATMSAAGNGPTAFGWSATSSGSLSTAVGTGANAASSGTAIGNAAVASTGSTVAVGYNSSASVSGNSSLGYLAVSSGSAATAIGSATTASGSGAVVVGASSTATASAGISIGKSISNGAGSSVVIGDTATIASTAGSSVVIGAAANASDVGTLGGERVVVGKSASSSVWRGTVVGYKATADAVSATAIGRGAYVPTGCGHGIAIGRGAWVNAANDAAIGFNGGNGTFNFWPNSGHTSKYEDTWSGDAVTINLTPNLNPIVIHGFDALDLTASPTNNVAGGNLELMAGRGTGTAIGGSVKLSTAPAGGVSNNTKNSAVTAVEVDTLATSAANESRFLLYDVQTGTMRRVRFGAADSGGSGFRALITPN